ncbi:replication initiation protein [Methylophaga nitratireducenticrescens]|uniref:replication initiation protein n=1 Tax=Methylophaga nitratireducenticrescens TaxID=754476 RepID=UPI000CDCABF8|nr:replication initiation protein [Methylophaga nitratireducenticrescens]AUZ86161.1 hypothetical protein CDW43_16025 [Methylophaga nitratireducenticrescens]
MKKSVEELKRSFGALDKYKKWSEFERRVIKPAVKSLNEHTSYDVEYETVKDGRPVVAVIFYFKEKPQLSLDLYRDSEIPQPSATH